jgi:hypothetical protein
MSFNISQYRQRLNPKQLRGLRSQAATIEKSLRNKKRESLQLIYQLHVAECLKNKETLLSVENYDKTLYWTKPRLVDEKLRQIDIGNVTKAFPLWVGEMRHLGHFLPFQEKIFDLVIVDEASQVNIAEIIPAIARGSRLCVVGDTKQLGLDSVGLFALKKNYEELCWLRAFENDKVDISLQDAEALALRVSKNSILDFVISPSRKFSIPKTTLNEHFRSVPGLGGFTSRQFYQEDGGLLLMRETPDNVQKSCFRFVPVENGKRDGKTAPQEAKEVIRILKMLIRKENDTGLFKENEVLPVLPSGPPTIGVLCFLTEQKRYIQNLVNDEFTHLECDTSQLFVGTTEEFQGNERQVMILTLGLDAETRYAKSFYENPRRFNVATSRAKEFTYLITSAVPSNADLLKKYLHHYNVKFNTNEMSSSEVALDDKVGGNAYWTYDPLARESEFERRVDEYLHRFIKHRSDTNEICLYNQIEACGQKRLDFVLHNLTNGQSCAVEVDGRAHYVSGGRIYSEEHLTRIEILRKAGWKIVHVPYYEWYLNGWLCDSDQSNFNQYICLFFRDLDIALGIG